MRRPAKAPSAGPNDAPSRGSRKLAAVLACALAVLALAAAAQPAAAASTVAHPWLSTFNGAATPAGKFSLGAVAKVGIDESAGRLYLPDRASNGAGAINVFDSDGQYLSQITGESSGAPGLPAKLPLTGPAAVDNSGTASDGRVYAAVTGATSALGLVYVFDATGHYLATIDGATTPKGSLGPIRDLAVDAAGNLYIADSANRVIVKYGSAGNFISQLSTPVEPRGVAVDSAGNVYVYIYSRQRIEKYGPAGNLISSSFALENPTGVTVDTSDDHVFVANDGFITELDEDGNYVGRFGFGRATNIFAQMVDSSTGKIYSWASDRVHIFAGGTAATAPDVTIAPAGEVGFFEATAHGTIDPLGEASSYFFQYRVQGALSWKSSASQDAGSGSGAAPAAVTLTGLSANTNYEVRLVGLDSANEASSTSAVETFATPVVSPPGATIEPVDEIAATSARFSGSFDPHGVASTAHFEYRTASGAWIARPNHGPSSGTGPIAVEDEVGGLVPSTTYFVKLVAANAGARAETSEVSFTTPAEAPWAYSGGAAPRAETTARLNGWVTPRNNATTYYFEFGPTASYGTSLPAGQDSDAGSGMEQIPVSAELSGLAPGTTYHFRLVAENVGGKTVGADREFRTRTASETGPQPRGIELVNNPDKGNQVVQPAEMGPIADRNATKILWTTTAGAPGGSTGAGNAFIAQRTPEGWRSRSVLPPADQLIDHGESRYIPMWANPSFDDFLFEVSSGINARPPRKYGTVDLAMRQEYKGELGITDVPTVPVRANDDLSRIYSSAFSADGTQQVFEVKPQTSEIVSLLSNDEPAPCGVSTSTSSSQFVGYGGYEWVTTEPGAPARVFFETDREAPCGIAYQVYMRDVDAGTTTLLSGPALPGGPQDETGTFIRASTDGSQAIFAATSRLVPEDTNDVADIYRYRVGVGPTCLTCVGPGANVQAGGGHDRQIVVSRDLSWIYFQSPNVLVPGVGQQGASNLYVWHQGDIDYVGSTRPPQAQKQAEFFPTKVALADGGQTMFFISFDPQITTDEVGETPQLYRYSAVDHSLECVSCVAGVPASRGIDPNSQTNYFPAGIDYATGNGDAAVFETEDALVRDDINGDFDIYEWRNGRIGLVTDGVTQYPGGSGRLELHGIGDDGTNVVFQAGANLTGYERDGTGQMYVARVGGGFPPPPGKPAPCGEESCQGPLQAPPPLSVPGSASVSGNGNAREEGRPAKPRKRCAAKSRKGKASRAKACAKKKHKARGKKKRHGAKGKKKSANRQQGGNR